MTQDRAASVVADCVCAVMRSFGRELDAIGIVGDENQRKKVIEKFNQCLMQATSCAVRVHSLIDYENNVNESEETVDDITKEISLYAEMKPNSGVSHDVIMTHFGSRVQAAQKRNKKGTKQNG